MHRSRFAWNLWGAVTSLATTSYSIATFLQYTRSYLALRAGWPLIAAGALSALAAVLIWSTALIATRLLLGPSEDLF